jgi:hypothetical protein
MDPCTSLSVKLGTLFTFRFMSWLGSYTIASQLIVSAVFGEVFMALGTLFCW